MGKEPRPDQLPQNSPLKTALGEIMALEHVFNVSKTNGMSFIFSFSEG